MPRFRAAAKLGTLHPAVHRPSGTGARAAGTAARTHSGAGRRSGAAEEGLTPHSSGARAIGVGSRPHEKTIVADTAPGRGHLRCLRRFAVTACRSGASVATHPDAGLR